MSSAVVTDYLASLVAKQVADNSLVVWYDPDRAYTDAVQDLELSNTEVVRYEGSFFALRHEIDHHLNNQQSPRLVVYVPEERSRTHSALIEVEAGGVIMQPGQQPPARNTRLAIVARNAVKSILGVSTAANIEKQVEAGQLSLADLNELAGKGKDLSRGVISIIFGSAIPKDVALAFVSSDRFDDKIAEKNATEELQGILHDQFDVELPVKSSLFELRERLTRHVLITDLIVGLSDSVPASLKTVEIPESPPCRNSCVELAENWRLRRDLRESYVTAAQSAEEDYSLGRLEFETNKIIDIETFPAVERALLRHVENALLESATTDLLELAQSRLGRFWSDVTPSIQAHWALIAACAQVLLDAGRVETGLKKAPATIPTLVKTYTDGKSPWCLLDTHHRHMESRWYRFEPEMGDRHQSLEELIYKARQRYTEVGSELARHFVTQYEKATHPVESILQQREVFEKRVQPKLEAGKTAYVWVDALRFEMARELCEVMKDEFNLTIEPAIGTIPTITEIGMAALLPRANQSTKVVSAGGGKLGLEIQGTLVTTRKDRIAFLKNNVDMPVFDTKLENLLPKPRKNIRDGIENAQLILVTSQEIDELGEMGNITQARRQMDVILNDLCRSFRVLRDLRVKTIIITADHGHIFADEIGGDMKIDAPGGETADLHRRVWVGVGGTAEPSYMRTSLSSLGVDSEYDIATPWTFACFRSRGGASAFFHGGLSPQELIIPVVVMVSTVESVVGPAGDIDWRLTPGSEKLTTRFFSVQIAGSGTGLFDLEPPKVRIEIRARGKCISSPVSASYGFEDATGEIQLKLSEGTTKKIKLNTVTVMLVEEVTQKTIGVHLVDAASGVELASVLEIENAISI